MNQLQRNLENLIKALKHPPKVRVGILGSKNDREGSGSNAEIGAKHEFGSAGMPQRSFLRVPLIENLDDYLEKSGAFDDKAMKQVLHDGTIDGWMEAIGHVAERVVADAFASGGFGKWTKWKTPGYTNNTGQILVDTQQLMKSISSEVVKK